jgi:hypothetical protein
MNSQSVKTVGKTEREREVDRWTEKLEIGHLVHLFILENVFVSNADVCSVTQSVKESVSTLNW